MLLSLDIKNVVLIEKIHLDFEDGLTVFTGETGAGKSILLDSLSLALGGRADTRLIRTGEESLSVSAVFSAKPGNPAIKLLQENAIDVTDNEIILRRTLNTAGKSRCFINDETVNAALMKEVGSFLLEIHGQFSSIGLLNESCHTDILDEFAGLTADVEKVGKLYNDWQDEEKKLKDTQTVLDNAAKEQDYLRYVADEIERLNPQEGEAGKLEEKCTLMANSEKTAENLQAALHYMSGGNGAVQGLIGASRSLEKILQYLPNNDSFKQAAESVENALAEAQEAEGMLSSFD